MDYEQVPSTLLVAEGSPQTGDEALSEALKPPSPTRPSPVRSDMEKIVTLNAQMAAMYPESVG